MVHPVLKPLTAWGWNELQILQQCYICVYTSEFSDNSRVPFNCLSSLYVCMSFFSPCFFSMLAIAFYCYSHILSFLVFWGMGKFSLVHRIWRVWPWLRGLKTLSLLQVGWNLSLFGILNTRLSINSSSKYKENYCIFFFLHLAIGMWQIFFIYLL